MADERRDNPVVLSRIYTRTGDDGTTAPVDGSRISKTEGRPQACADTDETNCAIGVAVTFGQLPPVMNELLGRVQSELFDVGADLANPVSPQPPSYPQLRVDERYVTALEEAGDADNAELPVLRSCRTCRSSSPAPPTPVTATCCGAPAGTG